MSLSDIQGHVRVKLVLQKQLLSGAIPHSYIFCGPRGVGKMMTAVEFVKAVHCLKSRSDGCGECSACKKVLSMNHPDIFFIDDPQGSIGVDIIRKCQKWLGLKPYESEKKVVIVNVTGEITNQASNCFLKTLEEPPGNSLIIICVVNVDSLPATILSRCQLLKFLPLPLDAVHGILRKRCPDSGARHGVIASLSRGCPGMAIQYIEQNILEERDIAVDLLTNAVGANIDYVFSTLKSIVTEKDRFIRILDFLSLIVRDITVIENNGASAIINSDIHGALLSISRNVKTDTALSLFWQTENARRAVEQNMNRQLVAESLFLKVQDNVSRKKRGC